MFLFLLISYKFFPSIYLDIVILDSVVVIQELRQMKLPKTRTTKTGALIF